MTTSFHDVNEVDASPEFRETAAMVYSIFQEVIEVAPGATRAESPPEFVGAESPAGAIFVTPD